MARRKGRREGRRWLGIVLVLAGMMVCALVWWGSGSGPRAGAPTEADAPGGGERRRPDDVDGTQGELGESLEDVSGGRDLRVPDIGGAATDGWTEVSREEGDPGQVATRLLRSYRDAGGCVLARSGYLDLTGSAWGCVVQGDGWTDVCVVCATAEEGISELRVLRLDADEMAAMLMGAS